VDQPTSNPVSHNRHDFHAPGLMGGGYVAPGYDEHFYDSHTAGFLNRNLHFRRGFYGEYLFDIPARTSLRILDVTGKPLAGAEIRAYQKSEDTIPTVPTFTGRTDANGVMVLPNRPVQGVTTATGHTLRPNPFGQINVVGPNGTMLLEIAQPGGLKDYRWLELIQLNEAFWLGGTKRATIEMRSGLLSGRPLAPVNLALGRPVLASTNVKTAAFANDGDLGVDGRFWFPFPLPAKVGQWWQVDLGKSRPISRVAVYSDATYPSDWYEAFHLEVSPTGSFTGEQTRVPLETRWQDTLLHSDYGMQKLSGFLNHGIYAFPPVTGRYVRIVGDRERSIAGLQELEVYGPAR
jgi:hypothetical protein